MQPVLRDSAMELMSTYPPAYPALVAEHQQVVGQQATHVGIQHATPPEPRSIPQASDSGPSTLHPRSGLPEVPAGSEEAQENAPDRAWLLQQLHMRGSSSSPPVAGITEKAWLLQQLSRLLACGGPVEPGVKQAASDALEQAMRKGFIPPAEWQPAWRQVSTASNEAAWPAQACAAPAAALDRAQQQLPFSMLLGRASTDPPHSSPQMSSGNRLSSSLLPPAPGMGLQQPQEQDVRLQLEAAGQQVGTGSHSPGQGMPGQLPELPGSSQAGSLEQQRLAVDAELQRPSQFFWGQVVGGAPSSGLQGLQHQHQHQQQQVEVRPYVDDVPSIPAMMASGALSQALAGDAMLAGSAVDEWLNEGHALDLDDDELLGGAGSQPPMRRGGARTRGRFVASTPVARDSSAEAGAAAAAGSLEKPLAGARGVKGAAKGRGKRGAAEGRAPSKPKGSERAEAPGPIGGIELQANFGRTGPLPATGGARKAAPKGRPPPKSINRKQLKQLTNRVREAAKACGLLGGGLVGEPGSRLEARGEQEDELAQAEQWVVQALQERLDSEQESCSARRAQDDEAVLSSVPVTRAQVLQVALMATGNVAASPAELHKVLLGWFQEGVLDAVASSGTQGSRSMKSGIRSWKGWPHLCSLLGLPGDKLEDLALHQQQVLALASSPESVTALVSSLEACRGDEGSLQQVPGWQQEGGAEASGDLGIWTQSWAPKSALMAGVDQSELQLGVHLMQAMQSCMAFVCASEVKRLQERLFSVKKAKPHHATLKASARVPA